MNVKWKDDPCGGFEAEFRGTRYYVHDVNTVGFGEGFAARYRPPQGRARLVKDPVNLGRCDTAAEAKRLCERHAADKRPIGKPE